MKAKNNFFIILILIGITSTLFSKEIFVKVVDKDIQIPLEGVKVSFIHSGKNGYTDKEGLIKFIIDDNTEKITFITSMIGYEIKKSSFSVKGSFFTVEMNMENIMQGKELVIEDKYYESKEEVGKSLVIDKEELKNLAMRGTVEDVVASIKTMPGISYSSSFMTDLSIRGSRTAEVAASYDGFIVRNPFYWGSGVSIFNPNIVESAKLNNGYFSVKNGYAMSGLLDVNIKKPIEGFKFDSKIALSTAEAYIQTPLGVKDMGLLFGGRATYLDATMGLIWKATGTEVPRVPYIYDGNLKWFYKPNNRFEVFVNSFVGADGSGFGDKRKESNNVDSESKFLNDKIHAIGFCGIKALPTDRIHISWLGGYEFLNENYESIIKEEGRINNIDININTDALFQNTLNSIQTRIEVEIEAHKKAVISIGGDFIYDNIIRKYRWNDFNYDYGIDVRREGNSGFSNQFNSAGFVNFNIYFIPELFEMEAGFRIDHYIAKMSDNVFNTSPAFIPRLSLTLTPVKNKAFIKKFSISLSSGLYSKMPFVDYNIDYPINSFTVLQEKVLTNVLGFDFDLPYEFNFKVESYFKYYFNRYYANETINERNDVVLKHHSDGYGYAAGFDLILKRKISRYIDGWISYSFVYARFINPKTDNVAEKKSSVSDPTGIWYYPGYHRWHSMNIVLNIKPLTWLTVSPSFGVHSGVPRKEYKDDTVYTAQIKGNPIILHKRDIESYDELRTPPSLPLSLKITFHWYFPRSKVGMEFYGSLDNILSFFYNPDSKDIVSRVDRYTGDFINKSPEAYETYQYGFGLRITY